MTSIKIQTLRATQGEGEGEGGRWGEGDGDAFRSGEGDGDARQWRRLRQCLHQRSKAMSNIDGLATDWLAAKADEKEASKRRLAIEKELTEALEAKDEGSITHTLQSYKVTLTQPVTRKIDNDIWVDVKHEIPAFLWPVKIVVSADAAKMKSLAEHEPKMWAKIAPAFETKQGKIGVKVEELK